MPSTPEAQWPGSRQSNASHRNGKPVAARRYLSVHFPFLATDRILRRRLGPQWRLQQDAASPLVLTAKTANALRLAHVSEEAARMGLETGTSLADARAAWPQLEVLEDEPAENARLLAAIAAWCDRYTPLVAIDRSLCGKGPGHCFALMLDITGCSGLFGGEAKLQNELATRLRRQGFAAATAIAPTPGCAWALAWHNRFDPHARPRIPASGDGAGMGVGEGEERLAGHLACLPAAALRLAGEDVDALARLGLRTIGQLLARPRAPLARRFGQAVLLRLDQALGRVGESITPLLPLPEMMAERHFAEPLVNAAEIEAAALSLARHLCQRLEERGEGLRRFRLSLYRVDGACLRLDAGTSVPERDPQTLLRLLGERIAGLHDGLDAGFGFETLRLAALQTQRFEAVTGELLSASGNRAAGDGLQLTVQLADRLTARLGAANVTIASLRNTHLPEEAVQMVPIHEADMAGNLTGNLSGNLSGSAPATPLSRPGLRPLRLFADPEPVEAIAALPDGPPLRFRWRKVLHQVIRSEGPERIADRWWDRQMERPTRDYYRVEDADGRRFWLFREGLYGRGNCHPAWFMHGLFA